MPAEHRKILLFCPDISGHRHLYAARFTRYFLERDCEICFAFAGIKNPDAGKAILSYDTCDLGSMLAFEGNERVQFVSVLKELCAGQADLDVARNLQLENDIEYTLFVDGDLLKPAWFRACLPFSKPLLGANVSLFVHTDFMHCNQVELSLGNNLPCFLQSIFSNRRIFRDRVSFSKFMPRFDALLFKLLNSRKPFGKALCLDEALADRFPGFAVALGEPGSRDWDDYDAAPDEVLAPFIKKYDTFLEQHQDKQLLLMIGDLENRKGYDLLVQAAAQDERFVVARFGRIKKYYSIDDWAFVHAREALIREGRLFECDLYLSSSKDIQTLMESAKFLVLPYRDYKRSSAVMVDAAVQGLPLVVSGGAVLGARVERYGLGRIFQDGNVESLLNELNTLVSDLPKYQAATKVYAKQFSHEAIYSILDETFGLTAST